MILRLVSTVSPVSASKVSRSLTDDQGGSSSRVARSVKQLSSTCVQHRSVGVVERGSRIGDSWIASVSVTTNAFPESSTVSLSSWPIGKNLRCVILGAFGHKQCRELEEIELVVAGGALPQSNVRPNPLELKDTVSKI